MSVVINLNDLFNDCSCDSSTTGGGKAKDFFQRLKGIFQGKKTCKNKVGPSPLPLSLSSPVAFPQSRQAQWAQRPQPPPQPPQPRQYYEAYNPYVPITNNRTMPTTNNRTTVPTTNNHITYYWFNSAVLDAYGNVVNQNNVNPTNRTTDNACYRNYVQEGRYLYGNLENPNLYTNTVSPVHVVQYEQYVPGLIVDNPCYNQPQASSPLQPRAQAPPRPQPLPLPLPLPLQPRARGQNTHVQPIIRKKPLTLTPLPPAAYNGLDNQKTTIAMIYETIQPMQQYFRDYALVMSGLSTGTRQVTKRNVNQMQTVKRGERIEKYKAFLNAIEQRLRAEQNNTKTLTLTGKRAFTKEKFTVVITNDAKYYDNYEPEYTMNHFPFRKKQPLTLFDCVNVLPKPKILSELAKLAKLAKLAPAAEAPPIDDPIYDLIFQDLVKLRNEEDITEFKSFLNLVSPAVLDVCFKILTSPTYQFCCDVDQLLQYLTRVAEKAKKKVTFKGSIPVHHADNNYVKLSKNVRDICETPEQKIEIIVNHCWAHYLLTVQYDEDFNIACKEAIQLLKPKMLLAKMYELSVGLEEHENLVKKFIEDHKQISNNQYYFNENITAEELKKDATAKRTKDDVKKYKNIIMDRSLLDILLTPIENNNTGTVQSSSTSGTNLSTNGTSCTTSRTTSFSEQGSSVATSAPSVTSQPNPSAPSNPKLKVATPQKWQIIARYELNNDKYERIKFVTAYEFWEDTKEPYDFLFHSDILKAFLFGGGYMTGNTPMKRPTQVARANAARRNANANAAQNVWKDEDAHAVIQKLYEYYECRDFLSFTRRMNQLCGESLKISVSNEDYKKSLLTNANLLETIIDTLNKNTQQLVDEHQYFGCWKGATTISKISNYDATEDEYLAKNIHQFLSKCEEAATTAQIIKPKPAGTSGGRRQKVVTGKLGGKYILVDGKKKYLKGSIKAQANINRK